MGHLGGTARHGKTEGRKGEHPLRATRILFKALLVLLACLSCLAPLSLRAEDGEAPSAKRTIVVGGDPDYPPYEFLDKNGQPAGYNVDLTRAIADVMGMKVEFRFGGWSEMRAALQDGSLDILQGISYSDDRSHSIDFSPPHNIVYHAVFARRDTPPVRSLEELRGKQVIVFKGGIMHDLLVKMGYGPNLTLTATPADALRMLASGQREYAVVAILPGMYLIRELHLTNLVPVAKGVVSQRYCYGVRKGNAELLARFSEGLAILMKTGQYQAIYDKWLGVQEPQRVSWDRVVRYGLIVLVPLFLILIGTVVWSRALQRRVALRTEELAREVQERKRALEELRSHQDRLVQADKMASLGILVSGVAHEINNPNGLILLNLPILREVYADAGELLEARYREQGDFLLGGLSYARMRQEVPLMLEEMSEGAKRIKRIVEDLKDFARRDDAVRREPFDLNAVVQAAVRLVEPSIRRATTRFNAEYDEHLSTMCGNAQRIEQVVVNLIINACQALPDTGRSISLRTACDPLTLSASLTVRDEGTGISPEHLPHLTDPFFTTKRETGGTGLGLSISAGIVKEHGGTLTFECPPGGGTIVTLVLPSPLADC
ncbi:transporter substrate-binding domain-containing protein [Geobacter sp. SVR]|uniref:transporter substrate-binding domain-containing protein n=1 Tax=Geobacter sp. SVR TaxID=2495594 RepID=UPI00143EFB80|nr:transporter substrate-binding domain-containing protein [Geobacter sp. SVR]BCS55296.1 histidine kinase [Geobacter sp. SVR]GCF86095.1 histidine kinase [Geobacter sp. SVR]